MSAPVPAYSGNSNSHGPSQVSASGTLSAPVGSAAVGSPKAAPLVEFVDVWKTYMPGAEPVHALRGVSIKVYPGEYLSIVGPSGSGKSTFMNVLGCLDVPTSGRYILAGTDVSHMDEERLAHVRNRSIGFVFQQFHLLPKLNAWRNVELPLIYSGVDRRQRKLRAMGALERVGLTNRVDHYPNQLSGGQQQRVAVARALVNDPDLVLADEPTGNLDSRSSEDVLAMLDELHAQGRTIILITHEHDVAAKAERSLRFRDGRFVAPEGAAA
ncbi:MAG TPA: ABC transporter ATP-binding protein [Acidimicrobiales bacterium]|nr:ABC transporter ATP-binding protein [Acidimicrobiales bacterium]